MHDFLYLKVFQYTYAEFSCRFRIELVQIFLQRSSFDSDISNKLTIVIEIYIKTIICRNNQNLQYLGHLVTMVEMLYLDSALENSRKFQDALRASFPY